MANIMVQWLMTGLLSVLHPFFVSVIDINHNAREAKVEISVRIFTDDLEKTLQKYTRAKIDLVHPADKALLEKQLAAYMSRTLQLKVNGQAASLHFLGYEIQQESAWSYFEIDKVPALKKLETDCSLLYDFETNQINIFHVKSNGVEKSYKLDYPATHTAFNF